MNSIHRYLSRHGFRLTLSAIAAILPLSLIMISIFLFISAWPAMQYNGLSFLLHNNWNLGNMYANPITVNGIEVLPRANYGVLFLIVGTVLTSLIALVLALPLGIFSAIFLAEGLTGPMRTIGSFLIELLAAVPSVVFGLWGYLVLIPLLGHSLYPWMAHTLGRFIPWLAEPTGSGYGLLTAGIVLAVMVVPLIAANLRDAIEATPLALREAGMSMGATRMEVVRKIILPGQKSLLVGVSILALGRALGETMAVLMVSGNALNSIPERIYDPVSTMASFIASQLDSAMQDPTGMAVSALAQIALLLMLISIIVNGLARAILWIAGHRK